jgi:hypothetical protein
MKPDAPPATVYANPLPLPPRHRSSSRGRRIGCTQRFPGLCCSSATTVGFSAARLRQCHAPGARVRGRISEGTRARVECARFVSDRLREQWLSHPGPRGRPAPRTAPDAAHPPRRPGARTARRRRPVRTAARRGRRSARAAPAGDEHPDRRVVRQVHRLPVTIGRGDSRRRPSQSRRGAAATTSQGSSGPGLSGLRVDRAGAVGSWLPSVVRKGPLPAAIGNR